MIQTLDMNILLELNKYLHCGLMDKIMVSASILGDYGSIWIVITIMLLCIKRYRKAGLSLCFGLITTSLIGDVIIKFLVRRPRPFTAIHVTNMLIDKPISYSFPSGHTAASFVAAYILSRYFEKYKVAFWILAILISYSRIYLFVHYPFDVLAGAVLGIICGKAVMRFRCITLRKE